MTSIYTKENDFFLDTNEASFYDAGQISFWLQKTRFVTQYPKMKLKIDWILSNWELVS